MLKSEKSSGTTWLAARLMTSKVSTEPVRLAAIRWLAPGLTDSDSGRPAPEVVDDRRTAR